MLSGASFFHVYFVIGVGHGFHYLSNMLNNILVLLFSCVLFNCHMTWCYDYCNLEKDCEGLKRHIVCHPEQLPRRTENFTRIPMSRKLRNLIVNLHNTYRNQLACGTLLDINSMVFPPAAKMRTLVWDEELEYVAGAHAEQCVVRRDECRLTSRYKRVGQNLAVLVGELPDSGGLKVVAAVQKFIGDWFLEHKIATARNAKLNQGEPQTGHFMLMINDRVSRLGCALTLCFIKDGQYVFLLTCNYSYNNMDDEEVYMDGAFVTKCERINSRASRYYRCLCEPSEG